MSVETWFDELGKDRMGLTRTWASDVRILEISLKISSGNIVAESLTINNSLCIHVLEVCNSCWAGRFSGTTESLSSPSSNKLLHGYSYRPWKRASGAILVNICAKHFWKVLQFQCQSKTRSMIIKSSWLQMYADSRLLQLISANAQALRHKFQVSS